MNATRDLQRNARAFEDASLTLMEPITGKNGDMIKELTIPKGTQFIIAIRALNRDKSLWGKDADEWKPERWFFPVPDRVKDARIPGIFSHL